MALLRFGVLAWALLIRPVALQAQTGCKPGDPTGYFEGSATSRQAGKLEVSLNLRCELGRYAGELDTPAGAYRIKDGGYQAAHLHLDLTSGAGIVTFDGTYESGALHGSFTAPDDSGPVEVRRTGDARPSAAADVRGLTKAQWHEDLDFLARELPKCHANAFHSLSRKQFEREVADLNGKLDHLNSDAIYVGMDRIATQIGDAHTYVKVPTDNANFPIDIQRFGDEYRITATADGNEKALGARVIRIDDTPIRQVHDRLLALTPPPESPDLRESRVESFLTTGIFLNGIGVLRDRSSARYTVVGDSGKPYTIDVHAVDPADSSHLHWTYPFASPPLFRRQPGESFWYLYLAGSRTVYCSFRGYTDLDKSSQGLFELIRQQHPDKLVVDMRQNGGGDYNVGLKYLLDPIRDLPGINRKGHLFVLVGSDTFSAAMANAAQFRSRTHALLVGQPIGERPNSYQEAREMTLPNSRWTVRYSVKFYRFAPNGENLIRPDKEIAPTWEDYRSGRDPVLEWALGSGRAPHP